MVTRTLSATAAAVLIACTALAADIVLSPIAGDARAMIEGALAKARPGDRVVLRAGEYRVIGGVHFPHGGERGKPITLCAAPGEYVALLGSARLTGWQKHEGKIWKVKSPANLHRGMTRGLYEDTERLTHPRPNWGKRENPPVSELRAPGTWTQVDGWIYVWSREGDTPDNHRIEASVRSVVSVNESWIIVDGLHMLFGENKVCTIHADNSFVVNSEIAHCSNSTDNSYNAYISGCSNSGFRDCVIHDSFYWGDHGSNSHTMSTINCGDNGPNFVDGCEIFNGGLGVGTKGAVRELVVKNCLIYDEVNGIVVSGPRSSGPGAGKTDRGHYVIYGNRITDCRKGIWISSGKNRNTRIWNNIIEHCGSGLSMRNYRGEPKDVHFANNILRGNAVAAYVMGGRKGGETVSKYLAAGLRSHNNMFSGNKIDWRNPLTWGSNLDMSPAQALEKFKLEKDSLTSAPKLDKFRRSLDGCPAVAKGREVPLPSYIDKPSAWHIGLGPYAEDDKKPELGLTLSIAGSPTTAAPGQTLALKAVIANEFTEKPVELDPRKDAIITYHFRYLSGHFDKQELYRVRVELPDRTLEPGKTLDLTKLPGWKAPTNGKLGDAFHLRTDTNIWKQGCRIRATMRLVDRKAETAKALQELVELVRSKEVLRMSFK